MQEKIPSVKQSACHQSFSCQHNFIFVLIKKMFDWCILDRYSFNWKRWY